MSYQVVQTTVFSMEKGGGNPCPVVLDADHLSTKTMQQMTKEFAHESAFVISSTRPDCDLKLRFFVPSHEMEMCIHATIGSITVLVHKGAISHSPVTVETMLGPVNVKWEKHDSKLEISVEQFPPGFLNTVPSREEIGRALNIEPEELAEWPVQSVSTSRYKLIIPLKSVETLNMLQPDFNYLWDLCDEFNTTGFYPFAVSQQHEKYVQARQFPQRAGYPEDPATGVAASALGAYLTAHKVLPPVEEGWNTFRIIQGVAMGKPSMIESETFVQDNQIVNTRIKGSAEELK
ncbi:PhzF family phenazine biosynthesis protein [Marinococcus halotolerans]|uniref:PhzF family phenazine biosynthesis protein n=1 Tax=Marinococcus halotolerans TaxID=301092 RepID=UPI0003B520F7|nr:PhzF family phenazine biosynthesis isomerase [Marinococcus halotolerans]